MGILTVCIKCHTLNLCLVFTLTRVGTLTFNSYVYFGHLNTKHIFGAACNYSLVLKADIAHLKLVSEYPETRLVFLGFGFHRPRDLGFWVPGY